MRSQSFKSFMFLGAIIIALSSWGTDAYSAERVSGALCTPTEIKELGDQGWSKEEIKEICGINGGSSPQQQQNVLPQAPYPNQPYLSPPRVGTVCNTLVGPCPMVQQLPIGSPCICATAFGPVNGVVQ